MFTNTFLSIRLLLSTYWAYFTLTDLFSLKKRNFIFVTIHKHSTMVYLHYTKNYHEFNDLIKTLEESKKPTYIVFTGTSNENGESWCSDCVKGIVPSDASTINNFIITLTTVMYNIVFCFSSRSDHQKSNWIKWGTFQRHKSSLCSSR